MDSPIFFVFLFIHLASLITGFGAVLVVDTFGLLWLLKKIPLSRVMQTATITQPLIWLGWSGMIASGIPLVTIKGYIDSLTAIKLFLVIMIGLNGIFLHFIKKALEQIPDGERIPKLWRFRMFLASTISQVGWWGAIFIGFIHRHIQHNIPWPASPWPYIGAIAGALLGGAFFGEIFFRKKA